MERIKEIIDELEFETFTLSLSKIGCFKRREGNILWLGIEDNVTLYSIYKELHQSLIDNSFDLEDREYKPHITLGRKVKLKDSFNIDELEYMLGQILIDINKVDLMKSEVIYGKLIYTVVHSKLLTHTSTP